MTDDLDERLAAYRGIDQDSGDDVVPTLWTPEYVGRRLIEAFDVLHRSVRNPGPKQFGNGWPSIVQNFEELIDWDAYDRALEQGRSWKARHISHAATVEIEAQRARDAEDAKDKPARPTGLEIEKADEASAWCARYLGDAPLRADALQLWAFCQARGLKFEKVLHRRAQKADARIEADRVVFSNRQEQFAKTARLAGRGYTPQDWVAPTRRDVMPDRVFTKQRANLVRKEGAETISRALNRARVMVR